MNNYISIKDGYRCKKENPFDGNYSPEQYDDFESVNPILPLTEHVPVGEEFQGEESFIPYIINGIERKLKAIAPSKVTKTVGDNDGWISVEERLPSEGGRYLVWAVEIYDLGKSCFVWNCYFDDRNNQWRDSHKVFNVTHWMPLPSPPKI